MRDVSGGRRRKEEKRVKRRRVSHIPRLMHGAIDSSSLPEHCPHFKESVEGGRRGWRDGGRSVCEEGRRESYS